MKALGIIPARYASTRFPGKPLAMIDGLSMVRRVYEQCMKCPDLARVIVATDSREIFQHVKEFGGEVMMTSGKHRSGTERCAEVLGMVRRGKGAVKPEAVINIQGDEPYINPRQISQVAGAFRDIHTDIATLAKKITVAKEITDPNVVKVVFAGDGQALYFRKGSFYKHVGIYGYRPEVLSKLVTLSESPLEIAESLEQLRWLEAGFTIIVRETEYETVAIDTPSDLLKITNIKPGKRH
jgi:3-deoxy-manno-octulosonate cytidylyltransferase (CMP-KDO synthetase)